MDKVLVHKGWTTLDVLVIGLLIVVVFESILTGLRSYVFSHTTSRIDVGKAVRLAPGMNVTAEIKTGRRRVIEYLLAPVQQMGAESLRER